MMAKNSLQAVARVLLNFGSPLGKIRLLFPLLSLVVAACSTYDPTGTGDTTLLSAPTNISFRFVSGAVEVSWQFAGDLTKLQQFRVYRRANNEAAFKRVAIVGSAARTYRDSTAVIGTLYQYQVSAVNKSNVEGQPSDAALVTPSVFGVQINNGAKFTNRRSVTLVFNVPNNTALMLLANDPAFTGAIWETFANNRAWDLTAGDGLKSVYVKFRTTDQGESEVTRADITLDTIALINALTHDGAGRTLRAGDLLHIRLDAGEARGNAVVSLIDNASSAQDNNLRLYDNGSNGDVVADDGVYELDYRIRPDIEFVQAFVFGNFTDAAGNPAQQRISATSFAVQFPPPAVTLSNPVADTTGLKLTWTTSTVKDFANYRVYRSTTSPVDSTVAPLTIINDNTVTTYRDTGISANTTYFYRVFVYDRSGLFAGSNQVQGRLK